MTRWIPTLALIAAALSHPPAPARAQQAPDTTSVELTFGVKIPMRDGVHLHATLYRPKGQTGPLPVLVWLTPYIADMSHARGMYFARNGYVFAVVDTRGRGNSEGRFEPFANEARDGPDLVRWLAGQPWSNGRVGSGAAPMAGSTSGPLPRPSRRAW